MTSADPAAALPPAPERSQDLQSDRADAAAEAADPSTQLGFVVETVTFTGARTLSAERLAPSWAHLRGQRATLTDLRRAAAQAERIYADAGYPFVAVLVPPQEVRDGQVRFDVVEGRISDLTVIGNDPVARRQAAAAFAELTTKAPLSADDVESAYQRARDIPGLAMSGALRRGTEAGGMDLVIQPRRTGWRAYANVNNLFSDPVGPWGALLGADFYGASLYGDQTTVQVYSTFDWEEQQVLRLGHRRRLNAAGTTVGVSYLRAQSEPGDVVAPLDLVTDVQLFRGEVSHPILARTWGMLTIGAAFDWQDQETKVFSAIPIVEDRTRVASLRASLRRRADRYAGNAYLELRQGLDIGDGSEEGDPLLSRADGDPQAFVLRAGADVDYRFSRRFSLYARIDTQWSDEPLLAPEEFSVGSLTIGRGFDPGAAFGDSAIGFQVEARFGPWTMANGRIGVSPFAFYDGVNYWNEGAGEVDEFYADSTGVGIRFEAPGYGRLDVMWAHPLGAAAPAAVFSPTFGDPDPDDRILVNLTVSLDDLARRAFSRTRRGT